MSRPSLIAIISVTLLGFILLKGAASLLCEPQQPNSVANVIASAIPAQEPAKVANSPDPLSWEPVMYRLINFLSKACPR